MTILPLTWADATGQTTCLPGFLYHRLAVPMLAATSRALRVARESPHDRGPTIVVVPLTGERRDFAVAALPFLRPSYGSAPTWPGTSNSRSSGMGVWDISRAPDWAPDDGRYGGGESFIVRDGFSLWL